MESKKIYLIGLLDKEVLFFKRIAKLSINRKINKFELVDNQQQADLIIVQGNAQSIALIEPISSAKTLLIAGDIKANKNCPEIVLQRPFLMSRVLKTLDQAVEVIPSAPPEIIEVVEEKPADPVVATTNITALVIDDSLPIRMQLQIALDDAGIKSELAESGEKGLELAEATDYDLVFLDIMMPGIDGYEVCQQMRKWDKMKKTPIIMLSGKTSPLDEVKGVMAGATTYMTKPVDAEQLQGVLKRMTKWIENFR